MAALGSGACGSSSSSTVIDLTVRIDPALSIDAVDIAIRAPGKQDGHLSRMPSSTIQVNIFTQGLAGGTVVNLEVAGIKTGTTIVLARAQVALIAGHRVPVTVELTAACQGVLSCDANQTCVNGTCVAIPTPTDGGVAGSGGTAGTGTADGSQPDVAGSGGFVGSGGAGGGGGGGGQSSGGSGSGGVVGTGGAAGAAGRGGSGASGGVIGMGGRAGGGATAGTAGTGGVIGTGGTGGTGGSIGTGGVTGTGGAACVNSSTDTCGHALGARGTCAAGTTTCTNGNWSACSVQPKTTDTCAAANDDTCNGTPNEGCTCINGNTDTCGAKLGSRGTCAAGTTICSGGTWGTCSIQPQSADTCDLGNDDTCDGQPNMGCVCDGFTLPADHPNPTDYDTSVTGIVTDRMTGLSWERTLSLTLYTQADAAAYCAANRLGGFSNWRLPTIGELVSIVDLSATDPPINSAAFPGTPSNYFWTSSTFVGQVGVAWAVRFINGDAISYDVTFPIQVRCVR